MGVSFTLASGTLRSPGRSILGFAALPQEAKILKSGKSHLNLREGVCVKTGSFYTLVS